MNPLKAFIATITTSDKGMVRDASTSIYDVVIKSLQGKPIDLKNFKGKKLLIVNVASKCGFTSQYKDLQKLFEDYNNKLMIIGVPCNQFGNQEPGNSDEIVSFCEKNYGVSFLMTEKVDVKGKKQHPLYSWLTKKAINGKKNSSVKWNFQKYLIDEEGKFLDYFYSTTNPISSSIISYLK